MGNRLLVSISM